MNQKILVVLGVLLLVVVAIQSVLLVRMSDRVEQLSQNTAELNTTPDNAQTDQQAPLSQPPSTLPPSSPDPVLPWDPNNWNPFEEMQRMQNEMNRIFGDMRTNLYNDPSLGNLIKPFSFSPNVDIHEEENQIIVTADIPGSDQANINVDLKDNRLTISATTTKSTEEKGSATRSERFIGKFERTVTLPAAVVAEKMKTDYNNGVLRITIPKA